MKDLSQKEIQSLIASEKKKMKEGDYGEVRELLELVYKGKVASLTGYKIREHNIGYLLVRDLYLPKK